MDRFRNTRAVSSFARVLPYVWPHRKRVVLSMFFALLVAILWGLNLSAAFPVVKILIQGQSLDDYAEKEIASATKEIADSEASLKRIEKQQEALEVDENVDERQTIKLLKSRSQQQERLSAASRSLHVMNWVKSYLLPWLPGDQFNMLAIIFGILLLAIILKGICIFIQDVLVGNVVELTIMSIRKDCFRHTLRLDYQTLMLTGSADIMSRFTHDLTMLSYGLRLLGGKIIREPLKAGCCILGSFLICWQLTLLSLLFVPLAVFVFYKIGRKLKLASRRLMESMSRVYKTLEETLDSIKVVIAFNGGRKHRQRFHRESKEYYRISRKILSIDALTSPTTEVLGMFMAFVALLPGAYLVLRHTNRIWGINLSSQPLDIAELTLLYVFLAGTIDPMRKLSSTYSKFKRASAAADRIFSLMDIKSLVTEPEHPQPLPRHSRSIEFRQIDFRYKSAGEEEFSRPTVLNEVNLTVQAGEVVVIVGDNGSGKSTLVNLLPRFYDPDRGCVLIDDVDIRTVRLRDLRSQIGTVTQETLLFDETIYENIRYGKPEATREEVEAAGRMAYVSDFIDQLPEGYETVVGVKGNRLSGGQRQRIALARALVRDPSILILDEATSAADAQSELLIYESLRNFSAGRTTFIITHSVSRSMLDFVTRVIVMDQGRLVATGTHDELLADCPAYQRLYLAQVEQRPATADPTPERGAKKLLSYDDTVGASSSAQGEPPVSDKTVNPPHIFPIRDPRQTPADSSHNPQSNGTDS